MHDRRIQLQQKYRSLPDDSIDKRMKNDMVQSNEFSSNYWFSNHYVFKDLIGRVAFNQPLSKPTVTY